MGNNPTGGKTWSDEKIAQLKRLWGRGHTASKIAGIMGCGLTRNSVIGAAHRAGLPNLGNPVGKPEVQAEAGAARSL